MSQQQQSHRQLVTRSVHLGFGAFVRAHSLLMTDEVQQKTGSDWGVCVVNLVGGEPLIENLRQQHHSYTVAENGKETTNYKLIQSVTESLHPNLDGIDALLNKMCEPQIAIVSLTITEKGYCADLASGELDLNHPQIIHDLNNPQQPSTAIGVIVQALNQRKALGLPAFTVMSCDNIQANGVVAKNVVLEFARQINQSLADWIAAHVTFPCTMVDRIVPAVTPETLKEIQQQIGYYDPCAVACEPYRQWVIEDNFVAGRPDWQLAGAQFVDDVVPYEEMKLRMLNGSHSFLAYLGYLGGYEHISDTMGDPNYKTAALALMLNEQAPSLDMPAGTDLTAYANQLIERYSNPSIKHRTWQIAMDGSQKIPQRFIASIRHHLQQGTDFKLLALAIAGWMRYIAAEDEQGNPIEVIDPMSDQLTTICNQNGYSAATVEALLTIEEIFPADLLENEKFSSMITEAYLQLVNYCARQTVQQISGGN